MSDEYERNEEKAELLQMIAQRIEAQARVENELGVDPGLPDLAQLRKGLEILRRELAADPSGRLLR